MSQRIPDWQLPAGVDRGLWDYLHSSEMVQGYDAMMAESALAQQDVQFCAKHFQPVGRIVDLGCGTARLAIELAKIGHACTGVDLSPVMLQQARENARNHGVSINFIEGNLLDLKPLESASFDSAACLFSTLGMVRGANERLQALREFARILKPGGKLVLHVHRRFYRGLGWRIVLQQCWRTLTNNPQAGDVTMSQHYGGAPLTLHHFTWKEATELLKQAGFAVREWEAIRTEQGVYGWLTLGQKQ